MAFPPISPFDPDFMKKMQILAQIRKDVPGAPPSEVEFLFNKYMNEPEVTNPFDMSSTPPLLPSDIDYDSLTRRERKIYQEQGFDLTPELYAEGVDREKFPRYPSSAFEPDRSGYTTIFGAPGYNEQGTPVGNRNTMGSREKAFNELLEKERGKAGYTGKIDPDFVRENYGSASGTIFDERIDPVTQRTLDMYGMSISDYWDLDDDKRKEFNKNIEYMGGKIPTGEPFAEEGDIESEDQLSLKNITSLFGNLNPYGTPMAEDLMRAGSQFASGRRGSKLGGVASLLTAGLEGARSFLTGMGAQRRWNEGQDWYDENMKKTQYTPVGQTQQGYLGDLANAEYGGLFAQDGIKELRDGGCYECGGVHKYPTGGKFDTVEQIAAAYRAGEITEAEADAYQAAIDAAGGQYYPSIDLTEEDLKPMPKEMMDRILYGSPVTAGSEMTDRRNVASKPEFEWDFENFSQFTPQELEMLQRDLMNKPVPTTGPEAKRYGEYARNLKTAILRNKYGEFSSGVQPQAYGGLFKYPGGGTMGPITEEEAKYYDEYNKKLAKFILNSPRLPKDIKTVMGSGYYENGGSQPMASMPGGQMPDLKNDPRFQPGEYIEFEYGGKTHKGIIKSNDGESIELE